MLQVVSVPTGQQFPVVHPDISKKHRPSNTVCLNMAFFFFLLCWDLALGKANVQKVLVHRTKSAHYNFMVCHYENVSQS